jgi:Na+/H+ antiporter NhaD/arsenite permease-like protein
MMMIIIIIIIIIIITVALVRERTIPTEWPPLVGEVSANFLQIEVVSVTDPYCRILGFLDRSRYFFFQVAPQLYSRG